MAKQIYTYKIWHNVGGVRLLMPKSISIHSTHSAGNIYLGFEGNSFKTSQRMKIEKKLKKEFT